MINLIPNEQKKKMAKDFYFRLVTVSFIMLAVSILVATAAILPSYLLSSAERRSINAKLELQKSEPISLPDQSTFSAVRDLKNKLNLVESARKNRFSFSQEIINEIVLEKIPGVRITGISYRNDVLTGEMIGVTGVAVSREVLVSFRHALEGNSAFSKVDLPISNFVKGSDIKFYLSLVPS